jgi:teichuronic acid biosynthesis glycosyltransferase TuaG
MITKPIVSIITPAYNAACFISEAICSVQAQDFYEWEMLIVDDCSPDDTVTLVETFVARDPRVKLLRQAENSGPAFARQRALEVARGRFIAFLDSDDYWLPIKLSLQLAFMHKMDTAISYTRYRRISTDGSRVGHLIAVPKQLEYRQLLKNTSIATSTVIVDREKTGFFTMMTKTYYDDYTLWLELLKRGFKANGLQEDLMRYRVVGKSVSRNKVHSAYRVWRIYRDVEKLGLIESSWCFAHYAFHAWVKYLMF